MEPWQLRWGRVSYCSSKASIQEISRPLSTDFHSPAPSFHSRSLKTDIAVFSVLPSSPSLCKLPTHPQHIFSRAQKSCFRRHPQVWDCLTSPSQSESTILFKDRARFVVRSKLALAHGLDIVSRAAGLPTASTCTAYGTVSSTMDKLIRNLSTQAIRQ